MWLKGFKYFPLLIKSTTWLNISHTCQTVRKVECGNTALNKVAKNTVLKGGLIIMRKLGKSGKTSKGMKFIFTLGSLAVIVILLAQFGVLQNIGGEEGTANIPTGCDSTTTPNLTIFAVDDESGSALTEATNLYRVKGRTSWSTFTAGTGFEVGVGKELEIVMGITTTDFTDNAYGQKIKSYVVPCEETPEIEYKMVNDEVETSLTATFLDTDENAAAEVYVAGQTQDVYVKLQSGTEEYFGNPYAGGNSNVIVLDLNSTEWDTPEKVYILGGAELNPVSVPIRHSSVAGLKAYAYELPVITDEAVKIGLKLNADDTTAPATDMTAYMYAGNYFYNADTQEIDFGVENEEGTAVGTDASDSLTLDFT